MNWLIDAYSGTYGAAMMLHNKPAHQAPAEKKTKTQSRFSRLFHRG